MLLVFRTKTLEPSMIHPTCQQSLSPFHTFFISFTAMTMAPVLLIPCPDQCSGLLTISLLSTLFLFRLFSTQLPEGACWHKRWYYFSAQTLHCPLTSQRQSPHNTLGGLKPSFPLASLPTFPASFLPTSSATWVLMLLPPEAFALPGPTAHNIFSSYT